MKWYKRVPAVSLALSQPWQNSDKKSEGTGSEKVQLSHHYSNLNGATENIVVRPSSSTKLLLIIWNVPKLCEISRNLTLTDRKSKPQEFSEEEIPHAMYEVSHFSCGIS